MFKEEMLRGYCAYATTGHIDGNADTDTEAVHGFLVYGKPTAKRW